MDNPETQVEFDTRHRTKTKNPKSQSRKLKRWATLTPPNNRERTQVSAKSKQCPFLVPWQYVTIYSCIVAVAQKCKHPNEIIETNDIIHKNQMQITRFVFFKIILLIVIYIGNKTLLPSQTTIVKLVG
jgi:hypothetical protein